MTRTEALRQLLAKNQPPAHAYWAARILSERPRRREGFFQRVWRMAFLALAFNIVWVSGAFACTLTNEGAKNCTSISAAEAAAILARNQSVIVAPTTVRPRPPRTVTPPEPVVAPKVAPKRQIVMPLPYVSVRIVP